MKQRILLIIAMLLIASPAFAVVQIISTQKTVGADTNVVEVNYMCTNSENIRAFALELTLGGNMVWNNIDRNSYLRGESNDAPNHKGYGIFPGRFRDTMANPGDPNWQNTDYMPVAPRGDLDSNGLQGNKVVLELGTLYKDDANKPGSSGTLCRLYADYNGETVGRSYTIAANATRGGVVDTTGATVSATFLGITQVIPPAQNFTVSGQVAGAVAPKLTGISGIVMNGLPGNPITDASGNYSAVCTSSGTCTPTDPNGQWTFVPPSFAYSATMTQNVTGTALECVNKTDPGYSTWSTLGKRDCWCYQKQCNGDTDGKASLGKNVVAADLTTFLAAYNKTIATLIPLMGTQPNNVCADFDHKVSLNKPVVAADLTFFLTWYNKTGVPNCPGPTINAWKVP
jgi:hypothetical protein